MLNRFVNSCGMGSFEHREPIVCGHQGMDRTQILRNFPRLAQGAGITFLQQRILKIHKVSQSTIIERVPASKNSLITCRALLAGRRFRDGISVCRQPRKKKTAR